MIVNKKEGYITDALSGCDPYHKQDLVNIISNYDELFQKPTGFPPKREVEHEIYLQQYATLMWNVQVINDREYKNQEESSGVAQ